jgi:hypothetical protein
MFVAFFLFGHRTGPQTLQDRLWAIVHAVPLPIWVAIIGVVAAIVTPVLNHYFTRRRDDAAAQRDERLRATEESRRAAGVRADLLARLRSHCSSLQPLAARTEIDPDLWQAAHDALARRARDPEVIDALGPAYQRFTRAVHEEAVAINRRRANVAVAGRSPVAAVLDAYAPVLRELERGS